MNSRLSQVLLLNVLLLSAAPLHAQIPAPEDAARINEKLQSLNAALAELKQGAHDRRLLADVKIYAKAAEWILRHEEFDKYLRGKVPVVSDADVTDELITENNLVLFGDPGSNQIMARILDQLPVEWTREAIIIQGQRYDPASHGLAMIFPNPLNPRRYVVINSGHTFHQQDFEASNAWLFPRLGDIAIQKFAPDGEGRYKEEVVWAALFNAGWSLPQSD
ncbi:MAG: hypothetical protein ACREJB_16275 [Planctomycetaceae bacterium]